MNIWGNSAWAFDAFNYLVPYQAMLQQVKTALEGKRYEKVLDAGCGTGNLEVSLRMSELDITALDSSEEMLARARRKSGSYVNFQRHDLNRELPFEQGSFGTLVSIHALYLVEDIPFTLREFHRVLKNNGRLVLVHPQPKGMGEFVKAHFSNGHFRTIAISLFQLPRMIRLFTSGLEVEKTKQANFRTPDELSQLIESAGFRVVSMVPTYGGISTLLIARRSE